jgi:hypothetical protein
MAQPSPVMMIRLWLQPMPLQLPPSSRPPTKLVCSSGTPGSSGSYGAASTSCRRSTGSGPFALAPGLVPVPAINISTLSGIKVYNASTEPLEPRFDGATGKIFGFLKQVQSAIVERGWTDINTVPKPDGTTKLWIPNYASHSMEALRTHILTYVNGQTRQAQDSFAMYTMLQKSLEPSYFVTVATAANEYMINGKGAGILLLKAIIMDVHHDLKGKASTNRQHLMALPAYMAEVKFDMKAFNEHVTSQMARLEARLRGTVHLSHRVPVAGLHGCPQYKLHQVHLEQEGLP